MKWQKLGQIFDFGSSSFSKEFISHAQSPQALVLEDRVRVFFSTRKSDIEDMFLSYVQYVDYDLDLKTIIGQSDHEVISLGNLGCFDEHGIFPLSPTKVGDSVYGYTNGIARRVSVPVETGAGLVISKNNGKTFERFCDGPILSASVHEPFMVGDPFVRKFKDKFYMFYIFGTKWSEETNKLPAERVYKIGYATSDDGIEWIKAGKKIIEDTIDENECQALPTVIRIGDTYHMYFCYRSMVGFRDGTGQAYRIGYAYSKDLKSWTRNDDKAGIDLSKSGWDSQMMCYPNVFECNNNIYLLYNGNEFGKNGFGAAKLVKD